MSPVFAVIYLLITMSGVALSLAGWVLPLDDGIGRYTCRYLACGCWCGVMALLATREHSWVLRVLDGLLMFWLIYRIEHWWRQVEALRKLNRIIGPPRAGKPPRVG